PVVAARPRCCVSTYVFAPVSQDGDEYFHVTSFMGRPGQNVLRLFSRADNTMRQAAGAVLKAGRGRKRLNSSRKG
ncbi:hypothetical protein, partial [Dyella sp.]|uniref:hypothetical protein n=1 Tax=Dyella sp. TaxID=1869338 RepID=UPI002D7928D5